MAHSGSNDVMRQFDVPYKYCAELDVQLSSNVQGKYRNFTLNSKIIVSYNVLRNINELSNCDMIYRQ